jgi:hypothetical protein
MGLVIYNKQLTNYSQLRLGGHEKQQLLFLLVHLILCQVLEVQRGEYYEQRTDGT